MTTESALQRSKTSPVSTTQSGAGRHCWTYCPAADIYDTPEAFVLSLDVPGAKADTIDITLESGILSLQAQVPTREPVDATRVRNEYGVGGFHRRFEVGDAIDPAGISASYTDGVLNVHLPKAPHSQRRRIPISS